MLYSISSSDPVEILTLNNNVVRPLLTMAENTTADLLAICRLNSEGTGIFFFFIISFKTRSFHCEICEPLQWMICRLATNLPIWQLHPFSFAFSGT